ncbi:Positive regulator of purine utilization [Colletotrichum spinosum]|uniref:Positive regulator of purine utilization n=1 Tax=Colletotrichum spinosum TaxID=1347390 RepID=A0A4V3HSP9_9PEZI|nr:Positive regulator of purine utilization [Colletotrichum spinosum]
MPDQADSRQLGRQSRRTARLRLACARCQRRKIRCDGQLPTCNNCKKASVACTDGESVRLRDLPRAQITNLRDRVRWLEGIVRERCPDIDLSQGPSAEVDMEIDGDDSIAHETIVEDGSAQPEDRLGQTDATRAGSHQTEPPSAPPAVRPEGRLVDPSASNALSHEIGMVSLGSDQDPKYIGPSSGYFLARLMLTFTRQEDQNAWQTKAPGPSSPFPVALVEAMQGPMALPTKDQARQLAEMYFDVINIQYPILHHPSFMLLLDQVYENGIEADQGPAGAFQVFMVLALGATVLSRRTRARLSGESYCLSALQYFDRINVENSIRGLQCLLLLSIFTMHSPAMRLNIWYLNYQCIAAVLDLGLQRDINTNAGISLLEQEMRTRIFWVVLMLDRMIATMMGRPIGLRDEACDLRLPQDIDDASLQSFNQLSNPPRLNRMSFSIHLFKLAKLNSEFKYVANSIVRDTPRYAYPTVIDINEWQNGILQQLDEWYAGIPEVQGLDYIRIICQVRYHGLRMLLLRPSPAIPNPSSDSLRKCFDAACNSLRLLDQLYKQNLLMHAWNTPHSVVLGIITMLYCLKMVPEIAKQTALDALMSDFSAGLGVLAATGEHWSGAKRCRDVLDDMIRAIVRWIKDTSSQPAPPDGQQNRRSSRLESAQTMNPYEAGLSGTMSSRLSFTESLPQSMAIAPLTTVSEGYLPQDPFESFLASNPFSDQFQMGEVSNLDNIMRGIFDDFIPTYPTFN